MRKAKKEDANFIVYPELALTTFFPRWYFEKQSEIDEFFETEMPNESTQPLFDEACKLKIGFNIGYLLDVLTTIESETVELNFYGEESSCLIREPGNKLEAYVIMPMRL